MPTVRIPMSLAMEATTWAAPLPVPPPMPAVTKTMSAPWSAFSIASRLSRAAFCAEGGSKGCVQQACRCWSIEDLVREDMKQLWR